MTSDKSHLLKGLTESFDKSRKLSEFGSVDARELAGMSDTELAAWEYEHGKESPHAILAAHEWQRRALAEQVRWMKWSVWAAVMATLLGAVVTFVLSRLI